MNRRKLLLRLRALIFRSRAEADVDDELQHHLEMEARKLRNAGFKSGEARQRAAIVFGGTEKFKEECRDQRGTRWLEDLLQDLRFAARLFRKDLGYSLATIAALAVGIGANTAVFTAFNAAVLKPLPVPSPSALVSISRSTAQIRGGPLSFADYIYYRDRNSAFASAAAETPAHLRLAGISSAPAAVTVAEPVMGLFITSNYLTTFGIRPTAGRDLLPEDDSRTAGPFSALLSENYWRRRFGADPGLLGQTLQLSGIAVVVVGITPRDFMGTRPDVPDVWIAAGALGDPQRRARDRGTLSSAVTARLKSGATLAQSQAELAVLASSLRASYPADQQRWSVEAEAATRFGRAHLGYVAIYIVLQFAMALVLLIACTNVAGLLLGRAVSRQREIAVRLSLGASRRRLIRQLLTEAVLISILAGAGAFAFTQYALVAISTAVSSSLASEGGTLAFDLKPDLRAFAYVFCVSVLAGVSFALLPAFQSTRIDLVSSLREETAGFGIRRKSRMRGVLIASQISVCLALLLGAALLTLQSRRVLSVDPGFETQDVVNLNISSPRELGYTIGRMSELQDRLNSRLSAVPGVSSVSFASRVPLGGNVRSTRVLPRYDSFQQQPDQTAQFPYTYVSQEYFNTLGIALLRGRDFTAQEIASTAQVAVISDSLARRFWPHEDAIGKRVAIGSVAEAHFAGERAPLSDSTEVIGIARDVYSQDLSLPDPGAIYLPKPAGTWNAIILVRVSGNVDSVSAGLLREIHAAEPNLAVSLETLRHMIATGEISVGYRVGAIAFTIIGMIGFALAAVGLYSMVAYTISQQTHEVGIRMALGADRSDVLRTLLGNAVKWVSIGLAFGVCLGIVLLRILASQIPQLFGGEHLLDPAVIAGVSLGTGLLALFAAYIPANRATHLSPAEVLRFE